MIEHAYIHIPFCLRKCLYCSFVSGISLHRKDIYLESLIKEIKQRCGKEKLKTLYIGGGTPSLLDSGNIETLISCFNFQNSPEITIEANPETVQPAKFKKIYSLGVNRISLGVQTFNDDILRYAGRGHTACQAVSAVNTIKEAGFKNINIDLMYGLPAQTAEIVKDDLKTAAQLANHISAYGLKIEKGSYFYEHKPGSLPDDDAQAGMYNIICKFLTADNFYHYEISNFAKKGFISIHNYAYWLNKEYFGFGVNAAGYENGIRYKNTSCFEDYIKNPFLKEEEIKLTKTETLENEIFLALRLKEGININSINKKFNIDFCSRYKNIIEKYKNLKLLEQTKTNIRLSEKGFLVSNEIMAEFIEV